MNIEDIKLKIKEIHSKVNEQEARILQTDAPVFVIDVDTQMMYIRILYDQYLSLQQCVSSQKTEEAITDSEINGSTTNVKLKSDIQTPLPSLFDFENEDENEDENENKEKDETLHNEINNTPEIVQTPIMQENEEKEEEIINTEPEEHQEEVEEEVEKDGTMDQPMPLIEIDIDNIEFVEEDDDEEEEEEMKHSSFDPYKDNFFPQINPMIDDKEPEIAIPITKEGLHRSMASMQPSDSLGDTYVNERQGFNEQFSGKSENNIANKLQKNQTNDLMKAIDINDKFQFIQELFRGNGSLFTETINQLNQFAKLTEVIDYLEKAKVDNRWKEDSEAYIKLYKLILKKYAKQ